tara:strand:+ start:2053 stop:3276 length:1224 start_codon:yes stop_codon:yes gene_type:complete
MRLAAINLDNVNKAVSGFNEAMKNANVLAINIGKKIRDSNLRLRKRISESNKNAQRKLQASRRKQREELIEALGIGGAMRRTGRVIKNTAKGFLGRILEFLSVTLIGWAIMNIPKILKGAQDLIKRLQKFLKVAKTFSDNIVNFLGDFGRELSEISAEIIQFDFEALKDRLGNIMVKIQNDFRSIERGLIRDVNRLVDFSEDDFIRQYTGQEPISQEQTQKQIDEVLFEQGIDEALFNNLKDDEKDAIRRLVIERFASEQEVGLDEIDLEDLQKALISESQKEINKFFKRRGVKRVNVEGKGNILQTESQRVNLEDQTTTFENDFMEGFNNLFNRKDDKKTSNLINPIQKDRIPLAFNFNKTQNVFFDIGNFTMNNNVSQKRDQTFELNSNDSGYASFENQFMYAIG